MKINYTQYNFENSYITEVRHFLIYGYKLLHMQGQKTRHNTYRDYCSAIR